MKWSELEALNVKRCCAVYTTGKQCRRRAADQQAGGFCKGHKVAVDRQTAKFNEAIRAEARGEA